MSEYNDLQAKASELGMEKVVGKSKEDLIAYIEEHSSDEPTPSVEKTKYNLATVFDGPRFVRQYDLKTHGKKFADLAEEFASSRKMRVELGVLQEKTTCPSCGHAF